MPPHAAESPKHPATLHKLRTEPQLPPHRSNAAHMCCSHCHQTWLQLKQKRALHPFGDGSELSEIKATWLQLKEGPTGALSGSPSTESWRREQELEEGSAWRGARASLSAPAWRRRSAALQHSVQTPAKSPIAPSAKLIFLFLISRLKGTVKGEKARKIDHHHHAD